MITSLRLANFKNFPDEKLRVGPFTLIVGANASGKSNIRDAFRFLHGIGRGYTLAETLGGKYGPGGQPEWARIRGAADEIVRFGQSAFSLQVKTSKGTYVIEISRDKKRLGIFRVTREELTVGWEKIYTSYPGWGDPVADQRDDTHLLLRMAKTGSQRKYGHRIPVRPDHPALAQIREHRRVVKAHKERAEQIMDILANMRFLDLVPDRMRQAAFPGQTVLGDGGENLPTVLQEICEDPDRGETFTAWTRELTPMDVRDFEFPTDPITGRIQLVLREANGRSVSAYAASDGTLRFLAMLAALLGKEPKGLYFFEEIDNGIHPARHALLLELIENQTTKGGIQVVTTTHSPDLLTSVNDSNIRALVCRRPSRRLAKRHHPPGWRTAQCPGIAHIRERLGGTAHQRLDGNRPRIHRKPRRRAGTRRMNVLIIPEDFRHDQYILKPLFSRLFRSIGKRRARVGILRDPLLGGVGEALKPERIAEVFRKYKGMTDIFILCIDRDGDTNRRQRLDQMEAEFGGVQTFLSENA